MSMPCIYCGERAIVKDTRLRGTGYVWRKFGCVNGHRFESHEQASPDASPQAVARTKEELRRLRDHVNTLLGEAA